jgi:lysophospholipase L1-like esterase
LWDLCYRNPAVKTQGNRDKIGGKLPFPIEEYERNLDQIVTRLKATGALLIWANTTVIPEGEAGRIVGDDTRYNRVAAAVMAKHHVAINDLHALTKTFAASDFVGPGDVHFSASGSAKLASKVAAAVAAALQPQPSAR